MSLMSAQAAFTDFVNSGVSGGRFRWPGTHSLILSGIQTSSTDCLGLYLKRSCSRVTSAASALGVLNDY